jgi:H+-transporting ATPase
MITGRFIVNAFDMILLLFIIDFVSLTLSTDTVSWSINPASWEIKPLIKMGFVLGLLNIAEALVWFFIRKRFLGITAVNGLHSFSFAILFFTGIFNIVIIRTPERFYKQKSAAYCCM